MSETRQPSTPALRLGRELYVHAEHFIQRFMRRGARIPEAEAEIAAQQMARIIDAELEAERARHARALEALRDCLDALLAPKRWDKESRKSLARDIASCLQPSESGVWPDA